MLILVLHAPPFRRWHRRLGERLEAAGHAVRFEAVGRPVGRRFLALERRLYGVVADWDAPEAPPPAPSGSTPALTIVLAGPPPETRCIVPDLDEAALHAAARAGIAPRIVVSGGVAGAQRPLASCRPAVEDPLVLARALDDVLPRLVTLIVQGVSRQIEGDGDPPPDLDGIAMTSRSPIAFLAAGLGRKLRRRFGRAHGRPEHWRIVLRRDGEDFAPLPDDGSRFRADPFLFGEGGRTWLFYEEFPYATGKGVIGCADVTGCLTSHAVIASEAKQPRGHDGTSASWPLVHSWIASPPARHDEVGEGVARSSARIVLDEPFHLSYPLVLRHRGEIYMLPEMSAACCVRLYRAAPFPHRWAPDTILIEGCRLADATPILHEGRWWLFATSTDDGGSSWDQLHLFHAPDLLGPWVPHARNPVLIDAGAARPAGRMWHEDGVLMRPAQDCRTGYGAGLVVCRVDRLDEGGYRQSVVRRMDPPPGAGGLHTMNREAGWEAVDLKAPHPR